MGSQNTKSQKTVTIEEWMESCKENHEYFYNQLGDRIWDQFDYPFNDKQILQKIAIPLFGKPMKENFELDLTDEQKKIVYEIRNKCIAHSVNNSQICMSVIFVFVYINDTEQAILPVLRVMSHAGEAFENIPDNIFIDHLGRVYDNWTTYKKENTMNQSWLCVPENGYYASQNNYEFLDQSERGKLLKSMDGLSTITNIATTTTLLGGIALSLFPPTAVFGAALVLNSTIAGVPSALYSVGRNVGQLIDRSRHKLSVSLTNSQARQFWMITACSLLAVGYSSAGEIIGKLGKGGKVVSNITNAVSSKLYTSISTIACLGVISSIYQVAAQTIIVTSDILQLTTSIFFFSHTILTLQTASRLISDAQNTQITRMRNNLSPEQQVIYEALRKSTNDVIEPGKIREMHGQAQFIREMKSIQNVEEFYSHFRMNTDGQLSINSQMTIHPRAFLQMSEADRLSLMNLSKELNDKKINLDDFKKKMAPIQKLYRLRLDSQRKEAVTFLKRVFAVDNVHKIRIGSCELGDLNQAQIDRLEQVVRNSFHNADGELMELVSKFSQMQGASNLTEYCATGEYAVRQVNAEVTTKRNDNSNPERPPNVKVKDFYKSQVVQAYLTDNKKLNKMNNAFNELRAKVDAVNTGHPKFNNSMAAANHYDKHPFFPKVDPQNNLSVERYFEIATEMAGGPITDIKWTQDGSTLQCTFNSDKYGATAIRYDNLANGTSVIATLMATNEIKLFSKEGNNKP